MAQQPDIDFDAIAKAYFQIRQDEMRRIRGSSGSTESQMMAPEFRNVKLTVTNIEWDDRTRAVPPAAAFANLTKNAEGVSGHVQAEAPLYEGNQLRITSGLISDIGKTLELPLDAPVQAIGLGHLLIDPSKSEGRVDKPMQVTQSMSWNDMPAEGASVQVVRDEAFSYEGKFACTVAPEGTVMVQCATSGIQGSVPKIQKMIEKLKDSSHHSLVKHFFDDQGKYVWVLEGIYMINKGTALALKS